jgi:predicted NBD/HSP70 family sugar kinase
LGAALQADGENEVRIGGLKHQKEKRSMDHLAGLDVSVKETSVCIVDDTGRIVREVKVPSEPEALLAVLTNPAYHFKRIGLEENDLRATLRKLGLKVGMVGTVKFETRIKELVENLPICGLMPRHCFL